MIRRSTNRSWLAACALLVAGAAGLAQAGPLDPPLGPITSTNKPIGEIEPRKAINSTNTPGDTNSVYRITAGGSYYLTENLAGVSGKHGIEIATGAPVTIDLNGFTLNGVAGSLKGIGGDGGVTPIVTVRNGTVTGFGSQGVEAVIAQDLRVLQNGGIGILLTDQGIVSDCVVRGNGNILGSAGIQTAASCIVRNCTVQSNGGASGGGGIVVAENCRVEACIVVSNGNLSNSGLAWGIYAGFDSIVERCRVNANGTTTNPNNSGGVIASAGAEVRDNQLYLNRNVGVSSWGEAKISNNKIQGSGPTTGFGILLQASSAVVENNFIASYGTGIRTIAGVTGCTIVRNTVRGSATPYDIVGSNDLGPIGTAASATSPFANTQTP